MIIKTSELNRKALNYAVAKAEGLVLRPSVAATNAGVRDLVVPFTLYEASAIWKDGAIVSTKVLPITITRHGVNLVIGETSPSITFTDHEGCEALGIVKHFYIEESEAKLEALRWVNGDLDGYEPSTDWSQGGQIIEREGLWLKHFVADDPKHTRWEAISGWFPAHVTC